MAEAKSSTKPRINYTHDAMIDLLLQEPSATQKELAEIFGYSPGWVQRIMSSDTFQARFAARKAQLVDPTIARSINERLRGVAVQSIDIVSKKLATEQSAILALEALGVATKGMSGSR